MIRLKEKVMAVYIQQLERKLKETRSMQMQVERGNPVRTFSGTDFKKNYEDKTFKKRRNALKMN